MACPHQGRLCLLLVLIRFLNVKQATGMSRALVRLQTMSAWAVWHRAHGRNSLGDLGPKSLAPTARKLSRFESLPRVLGNTAGFCQCPYAYIILYLLLKLKTTLSCATHNFSKWIAAALTVFSCQSGTRHLAEAQLWKSPQAIIPRTPRVLPSRLVEVPRRQAVPKWSQSPKPSGQGSLRHVAVFPKGKKQGTSSTKTLKSTILTYTRPV